MGQRTVVWFVVEMCEVEMMIVRITSRQTKAGQRYLGKSHEARTSDSQTRRLRSAVKLAGDGNRTLLLSIGNRARPAVDAPSRFGVNRRGIR
jgi:hypothetical protein